MTYRSLSWYDSCLKGVRFLPTPQPQCKTGCRLHTKVFHGRINHKYKSLSSLQHYRSSSNIIKSPFKDIEIPNQLIPEMIWETVDKYPESTALKCGITGQTYTYAQLQRLSFRFANSLRKAGFRKGEVIALVLPNCPDFAVIVLGALEAELAVCFVNHVYTADEMCHQLKDSKSVCVVTGPSQLSTVQAAIKKVEESTQSKLIRKTPVIVVDIPKVDALDPEVVRYSEMIVEGIDQSRKITNNVSVNDLALLPYSSGTTGLSKGVCLSHRNIVANTCQMGAVEGKEIRSVDEGQDIVLGLLPFYHIYGLTCTLLDCLKSGGQIITLPRFEQDSFIQAFEKEKFTVLMLVPPLILYLGSSARVIPSHLQYTRLMFSGAAPLGASDMEKVKAKIPSHCLISQGFGMTETSPVVLMPSVPTKNLATSGVPVSCTQAKVIDVGTGQELGPNQSGELCFKGPQVMLGYLNNPKATAEMIDKDGWLRTGDIGYYDEDNHFYVKDRLKELIKVKGLQVPPAELEEVIRTHSSVNDVGVIGVPDPRAGEVPVAFIVTEKDKKLSDQQVKDFLAEKVSRHKQVSEVIFVDSIPKSAAGKILRKDLRELYKTKKYSVNV